LFKIALTAYLVIKTVLINTLKKCGELPKYTKRCIRRTAKLLILTVHSSDPVE
jgi:hypothetical protein